MNHVPDMPLHRAMAEDRYWNRDLVMATAPSFSERVNYRVAAKSANTNDVVDAFTDLLAGDLSYKQSIPLGTAVPVISKEQRGLVRLIIDDRITGRPLLPYDYAGGDVEAPEQFDVKAGVMERDPMYVGQLIATRVGKTVVMRSVVYVRGYNESGWPHVGVDSSSIESMVRGGIRRIQSGQLLGNLVVGRTELVHHERHSTYTRVSSAILITQD